MPFFLLWGFFIWLAASAFFRLAGPFFFTLEHPLIIMCTYLFVVPVIWMVTIPIYSIKNCTGIRRLQAAIYIALPGMLIDAIVLLYFDKIFTNLSADMDRFFASWLLWAYALIILTGCAKNPFRLQFKRVY
ncbi:DUF5367 domain-containing protein [Lysinibacillus pakistanensis]|uniref:DUF5367 domain-containing protein n=1 Tax=Lysinibacillus pakistanensis TaxID=759811 RepID=A0AAX3X0I9_9BACI|nr:DUF5367 domain-containing protein [Lysinibacillus pakistanensis]MDM5233050.1 DUF5367 domain-containing protein [Lysinibacillus pakistanensis]WHY48537.1 DUF5367 domain-containing protein [Lysinibacillus pakistanensis]WHY53550.1 DUF5367 domain-containing protein [Lysinibacillus pakistanensis]